MAQLREHAKKKPSLKESHLDSVAPVKITLSDVTVRLEVKKKKFIVNTPASEHEISDVWSHLKEIDPAFDLGPTDKIKRVNLPPGIQAFLKHCCYERHYSFEIRKCGDVNCKLCKPPRLPPEIFKKLHSLPNKPFGEVFGKETSEEHRPSLNKITSKRLPFYPSIQHVLNCNTMLMCDECGMWRLVYSTRKLKPGEIRRLKQSFDDVSFSCGADLQEADIPAQFKGLVYVKKMHCNEPIERLHYSANYTDICIYCAGDMETPWSSSSKYYPQCDNCKQKDKIPNTKNKCAC